MALITSQCGTMRLRGRQMALITSQCGTMRPRGRQMALITSDRAGQDHSGCGGGAHQPLPTATSLLGTAPPPPTVLLLKRRPKREGKSWSQLGGIGAGTAWHGGRLLTSDHGQPHAQHGLSANRIALITSDCGAMRLLHLDFVFGRPNCCPSRSASRRSSKRSSTGSTVRTTTFLDPLFLIPNRCTLTLFLQNTHVLLLSSVMRLGV